MNSDEKQDKNYMETEVMEIDLSQSQKTKSLSEFDVTEEKCMEEEEDGDEPDAMTTSQENLDKIQDEDASDSRKLYNSFAESPSGDEDVEEDNRLVIDDANDDNVLKSLTKSSQIQDRVYTCPQCGIVTTTPKAYLYHLDTVHRAKDFAKNSANFKISDDPTAMESSINKSTNSDFVNLSIPLTDQSSSMLVDDDDGGEEEPQESNHLPLLLSSHSSSIPDVITRDNIDKIYEDDKKKKKKTRQEVDPGKYFEAVDSSGTKYACSQCGNIYKWRKSLNKHWKEKHLHDPLLEIASPPGMLELLKSGKYTQLGSRRIYDNTFLATIKTQKEDNASHPSTPNTVSNSPSPPSFLNSSQILNTNAARLVASMASTIPAKMIGPFVANGAQPVFPGMGLAVPHLPLPNGFDSNNDEGALDLTRDSKNESSYSPLPSSSGNQADGNASFDQDQPLDFSKKKEETVPVKHEKLWDEITSSMKHSQGVNQYIPKIHRCSKCDYTSVSESDFAAHTGSHYNKRMVKCFECKIQYNSMEELNSHFLNDHHKKLTEYKEAIKKIPHGLQQTYHLLKMDLQSIGELNNQDLGSSESKSLKCKKCDFEAKWPAELQKHAVSHSEERPYICMVCGSTYKWKWDLVKHFQKSHPTLPNPYRRNDKRDSPDGSSEDDLEEEPESKKAKMSPVESAIGPLFNADDGISVEGIIAATQAGQRFVSSQPNLLDNDPTVEQSLAYVRNFVNTGTVGLNFSPNLVGRQAKAQKAIQDAVKNCQGTSPKKNALSDHSVSPSQANSKNEPLPYKCTMCNYHARWPSEITQHMKNHSDSKPYLCPRCDYRSKWKWDVVKHLKRCGGGTISDVIDTTKLKKKDFVNCGPPNAIVSQHGKLKKMTPQALSYLSGLSDSGENGQFVFSQSECPSPFLSPEEMEQNPEESMAAEGNSDENSQSNDAAALIDLTSSNNNNDESSVNNNVNNNYATYINGQSRITASPNGTGPEAASNTAVSNSPVPCTAPIPTAAISGSRQNNSAEIWDCPHCSFSTHSQAELKRHSGLHKDDKPFKCDECNYSTRWACDLKKHRKSYDHYPKRNNQILNSNAKEGSRNLKGQQARNEDQLRAVENKGRFKCFQCSIFFMSLQDLINHRKSSHTSTDTSTSSPPDTMTNHEIDAARIKHPRKLIKQLSCPKCPFLCKTRQTMEKHMEEHEQMERNALHCFYCSSQFKDKECLLDHIVSHSAFNPKEWETFFMISEEEEQHLPKDETNEEAVDQNKMNFNAANEVNTPDKKDAKNSEAATQARIQQILNEIPKQASAMSQQAPSFSSKKFQCEWCPAVFNNLTAVYKHASQDHPIQLKEQDTSMSQANTNVQTKPQEQNQKTVETEEKLIRKLRQQIHEKRQQHSADKLTQQLNAENFTEKELQEHTLRVYEDDVKHSLKIKTEEEISTHDGIQMKGDSVGANTYLCDKCNFSSPSKATFELHSRLHGSNMQSQCWFCDYSIDRSELLYQHMKISHVRKWKALAQDAKYASQIQKLNFMYGNSHSYGNNNDSPPGPSPTFSNESMAMDLSSKRSSNEITQDVAFMTKQQYTWNGVPINIAIGDNKLSFACPICSFTSNALEITCTHVRQNHNGMSKFYCKRCNFSDDNVQLVSDHCKTSHPVTERLIEVMDFRQLNFQDFQRFKSQLLPGKPSQVSPSVAVKPTADEEDTKFLTCPFCPFKSPIKEAMKEHVLHHNSNSRFQCKQCDFSVDSPPVMTDHLRVHSPGYNDGKGSTNVMAQLEGNGDPKASLSQRDTLKSHEPESALELLKSTSPKSKAPGRIRYRCSACPYHTTCKSNIFKHKRQHVNPKRYKCPNCTYSAARAVLLKNHIESHNVPVEDEEYYHDIFYDPNNSSNDKNDDAEIEDGEMDEGDDEGSTSDDLESEMDTKAIADLEAKDIMEAEAVYKATMLMEDEPANEGWSEKQSRKQKCIHCPFSSNSAYEFRKHLNFHGTQERYKCDHCNYSIDRLNLLSQHRKLHMEEPNFNMNPLASDLLNTSFILQQSDVASTPQEKNKMPQDSGKEDTPTRQFCCSHCPYKVTCKKSYDIHTSSHGQRRRFICDFCDWSADRISLLNHHRIVHENDPSYDANLDDKNFLNLEFDDGKSGKPGEFEAKLQEIPNVDKSAKMGEGESAKSPPFKLTVVKKSYPCDLCPYKTSSKSSYQIHQSMHGSNSNFTCSQCNFAAPNQGVLQQHIILHSVPNTFEVPSQMCSKSVPQLDLESAEMKTDYSKGDNSEENSVPTNPKLSNSTTQSEYTCERCPFTTSSISSLSEHMKSHNKHEQLACPYCDFGATSRDIMFPHIQIHFPGTKLEPSALERMIQKQSGKINNNNNNENSLNLSKTCSGSPDEMTSVKENKVIKTKIYVCQYCEREFEAKSLMIQHEKQHLVGSLVE